MIGTYHDYIRDELRKPRSIYVIGSLRNPRIPLIGDRLRGLGFDVFDDWFASGPEADDWWKKYEQSRGRSYEEALKGYMAKHIFAFDKAHLDRCDMGVLVGPAGKSAHMEITYLACQGKPAYMLLDADPERWDVMVQFVTGVFFDEEKFFDCLKSQRSGSTPGGASPVSRHPPDALLSQSMRSCSTSQATFVKATSTSPTG